MKRKANQWSKWWQWWQNLQDRIQSFYEELYYSRYRREAIRDARALDDLFLVMTATEFVGLENPLLYYTLELYPWMLDEYHTWHLRMGMDHSPLDRFGCC